MTWVIKILQRDVPKIQKVWNGVTWVDTPDGTADFMINDFQFSESTWREVSFERIDEVDVVNRVSVTGDVVLTPESKRYQFIEPLIQEINVVLPDPPQFHLRYLIKNLSEIDNKINVLGEVGGDPLFVLDSTDELAILFHDEFDWHIAI